jgi:hypothetical protein
MQAYAAAVRELTSRDFTFKSDVLNAFAGIPSFMRPFFREKFHNPVAPEHLRSARQKVNPTTGILKFTAISAEFIITKQRLRYAELDPSKPRGPVTNTAGLRGSLCIFGYDASVVGMVKIPDSVLLDMESGPLHFVALSRTNREQVDYYSTIDTGKDSRLQSTGKN